MQKYTYILLFVLLISLLFGLSILDKIEAPYIEYASFPRCDNDVVVTNELRAAVIDHASEKIKIGTGESYFNSHYIFKNLDYSLSTCTFVVRYEYVYDELHTEMSVTVDVLNQDDFQITETKAFLRPVGLLVTPEESESIAAAGNVTYDYYNVLIDSERQTFLYKFYKDTLTEGNVLVFMIDGQSKEIIPVKTVKEFVPIV